MNIEQINTFIEVALTGSFSKAAGMLYKTQPAVSRTISSLEKELDTQLFIRAPHQKVLLTNTGQIYYDVFLRFRDNLNEAQKNCRKLQAKNTTLRLGHAPYWISSFFLPQLYRSMSNANLSMNISVECHEFSELSRRIYEKYLDIAITIENDSVPEYNLNSVHLCKLPKVIVYSKAFDADSSVNDTSFFSDKDFLLYNNPYFLRQKSIIKSLKKELGFDPSVKGVVNMDTLTSQAISGQGVILLDKWCQQLSFPSLSHYTLKDTHNVIRIYRNDTIYKQIVKNMQYSSFCI